MSTTRTAKAARQPTITAPGNVTITEAVAAAAPSETPPSPPAPSLPLPATTVASGHSTLTAQKRRHMWWVVALRAPFRAVFWVVDCIDDKGDPSLVKGLALAFGIAAMMDMLKHQVGAANTTLAGLCICAAFGRSMMMAWLNRFTWSNTTSQTLSHASTFNAEVKGDWKDIFARRDPDKGAEATP